jgi:hypothetical protein
LSCVAMATPPPDTANRAALHAASQLKPGPRLITLDAPRRQSIMVYRGIWAACAVEFMSEIRSESGD